MKINVPLYGKVAILVSVAGFAYLLSFHTSILNLRKSKEYLDPRGLVLTNSTIAVGKQKIDELDAKEIVRWALSESGLAKECEMDLYFSEEKWRAVVAPLDSNSVPVLGPLLYVTISKDGRELSILRGH